MAISPLFWTSKTTLNTYPVPPQRVGLIASDLMLQSLDGHWSEPDMKRYRLASRAHSSLTKAAEGFHDGHYRRGNACIALLGVEAAQGSFTELEAKKVLLALQNRGLLGQDTAEGFWNRFACVTERHKGKAPFVEQIEES
jgi:hypothetical protein